MSSEFIKLKGIRTHNLKSIDIQFPLEQISVVTGVSGSGKSSLVFDSLYAESHRRYFESLSSYARQYLQALPKPDIDDVENLLASVAVRQNRTRATSRSTVGSLSEIDDVLRLLLALQGEIHCPHCDSKVQCFNAETMADYLLEEFDQCKVLVLASLEHFRSLSGQALKDTLLAEGFHRLYHDGKILRIEDNTVSIDGATTRVVIDRVVVSSDKKFRLIEACLLAFKLGMGKAIAIEEGNREVSFHEQLVCCGHTFRPLSESLFNPNLPIGACDRCLGFGTEASPDVRKIIPDADASLVSKGVACWNFGQHTRYYSSALHSLKKRNNEALLSVPFRSYSDHDREWLWNGDRQNFVGINGYFQFLDTKKYKQHLRIHAARFRRYIPCSSCTGQRLNRNALAVYLSGKNYSALSTMAVSDLLVFCRGLQFKASVGSESLESRFEEAISEAISRLTYLDQIGLGYLQLNRAARTLSGGELQRMTMARSLGSPLTGTLFCLDEPSVGLHPADVKKLLQIIEEIKALGNTLVVVEHDPQILAKADYLVKLGPGAGRDGGEITYQGPPLGEKRSVQLNQTVAFQKNQSEFLALSSSLAHNLRIDQVSFPIRALTVICGVSGSGKTSLINHCLVPLLSEQMPVVGGGSLDGILNESPGSVSVPDGSFERVLHVTQEPLARSTRSNIATYLGVFTEIRQLLSQTPEAKALKLIPGSFSFNIPGGRCETCKGLGTELDDLSFLGELEIVCRSCHGNRFKEEILQVKYRDLGVLDLLRLTVDEAREVFFDVPKLVAVFKDVGELGLGYVRLGQNTSSFSGGEAQRLKLLGLLRNTELESPCLIILDEPSAGLANRNCYQLVAFCQKLVRNGHTLIVIDHHLQLLAAAQWIIELGPGAGAEGGRLLFQGERKIFSETMKDSVTAPFLREFLASNS